MTPTPKPVTIASLQDLLVSFRLDSGSAATIVKAGGTDPRGDWFDATGQATTIRPAVSDLATWSILRGTIQASWLAQLPACGAPGMICGAPVGVAPGAITVSLRTPLAAAAPSLPLPGDFRVLLLELGGPIVQPPDASYELGIVAFDQTPLDSKPAERLKAGATNFLTGTNLAYSVRFGAPEYPPAIVRLTHDPGEPFIHQEASAAFAIYRGNTLAIFIPEAEWDGVLDWRLYSFYSDSAAKQNVNDTAPDIAMPMHPDDVSTVPQVDLH